MMKEDPKTSHNNANKQSATTSLTVGVRDLVDIYRQGNLRGSSYGLMRQIDGTHMHQICYRLLAGDSSITNVSPAYRALAESCLGCQVINELPLQSTFSYEDTSAETIDLKVRGRADLVLYHENRFHLWEVKTLTGDLTSVPELGYLSHRAQLFCYHAILQNSANQANLIDKFCQCYPELSRRQLEHDLAEQLATDELYLALIYMSSDALVIKPCPLTVKAKNTKAFLQATCEKYLLNLSEEKHWQKSRNAQNKLAHFPFPQVRSGQKELMQQIINVMASNEALLAQAPTGTGKTIATLYPALKAQAQGWVEQIFYATAKNVTRSEVARTLALLRSKGDFKIRSVILQAKEISCLKPELFCDHQTCPYAQNYYDRLPDAINELRKIDAIDPAVIQTVAQNYQLCPFELSLEIAKSCDVLVGDYNHLFDPKIRLQHLFRDAKHKIALLVDEAHNLPSRSQSMYSATIKLKSLQEAVEFLNQAEYRAFNKLKQRLEDIILLLEQGFSGEETQVKNSWFREEPKYLHATATLILSNQKPLRLLKALSNCIFQLRQFLSQVDVMAKPVQNLWFDILFCLKVANYYYDQNYIFVASKNEHETTFSLLCLDASKALSACYLGIQPTVFFSATMRPLNYYKSFLASNQPMAMGQKHPELPSDMELSDLLHLLHLGSPFPAERKLVVALDCFSLRYADRKKNLPEIAQLLLELTQVKAHNILVFTPSFQYQQQLKQALAGAIAELKASGESISIPLSIQVQKQQMDASAREKYLAKFSETEGRSLLSIAVLGSHFSEGIDLKGDLLTGVVVVGTGLTPPTPESEVRSGLYQERFGNGYNYAYTFPGFNKVEQAVGRLIRSETDYGYALLIDSRYQRTEYRHLFPLDWRVKHLDDPYIALDIIRDFFEQIQAMDEFELE